MDPIAVLTMFGAGIAGLWWYLKTTTDNRITDLKAAHDRDREAWDRERLKYEKNEDVLEAKIEKLNDIVTKNTDSLTDTATALNTVAGILQSQHSSPSRSTATVTDPPRIGEGQ